MQGASSVEARPLFFLTQAVRTLTLENLLGGNFMKKKLLTALITIVMAVGMAFCLAACNLGGNEPESN